MIKKILIILLLSFTGIVMTFAQSISLRGYVKDDTSDKNVKNAVAMAVRLSDSVLVKFSRSDSTGFFRLEQLPVDTYQIVFSHPKFGERTYIIMGNPNDSVIDFKNISLPVKSTQIAEVTIYGFTSPVYFKGDTLVYAADSFKVKPNAVVEDLLKKLPGIRVDNTGKIYSQGEQVDKVLVDGDEFFGADPTIATRNLPANSVESVQVYDKTSNNSSDGPKEKEKVLDLKLKEDAKRGYFGKVSAAGDFDKFFEEQLLLNRFRKKQKISVFSLGSNTLYNKLNWDDINEYGLYNESDWQYSEETDTYISPNDVRTSGIPRTFKNGIFFSDKVFKNTDINLNYTNTVSDLETKRDLFSQYLFSDTSYQSIKNSNEKKHTEDHNFNLFLEQKIDSLTTLTLSSNFKYNNENREFSENNQFWSEDNILQRESDIYNSNRNIRQDFKNNLWLYHDFMKKDRELNFNYRNSINNINSSGQLITTDTSDSASQANQAKYTENGFVEHLASVAFIEPLSKKVKTEVSYDITVFKAFQDKMTFDMFNGTYELPNDSLTNSFENSRLINRFGLKFIYDTKKRYVQVGTRLRQITSVNKDLETNSEFSQTINAILPYLRFRYNFPGNARFNFNYMTSSKQPELNQLQPLPDNSNPNFIYIGNPTLRPTYNQIFSAGYNFFKAVTGNSMWTNLRFTSISNAISNSVQYDSSGKSITQPINVKGTYNGNFNFNYYFSFFSRRLSLGPTVFTTFGNTSNLINGQTNTTQNYSYSGGLEVSFQADSGNLVIILSGNYGNRISRATISSFAIQTYITGDYKASVTYDISKTWSLASDLSYIFKTQQAGGTNIENYIWGASLSKKFFKKESLTVSIEAYDLLNERMEAEQTIMDNILTYSRSNTVGRYVLLKAVYKFNSNKTSENVE